jgi:hypothetical protein
MRNRNLRGLWALGALCLIPLSSQAASYYMLPTGTGSQNGSSWANALGKSALATTINTTMVAGDTLYLGSGNYGTSTISLASSGSSGSPKTISGVDTGTGLPNFETNTWVRTSPTGGQYSIIGGSGNYWVIENLALREAEHAIRMSTASTNITFRNLLMERVRHGVYVSNLDNALFEDCSILGYTKHGYRLDQGCDNVTFRNCVADMTAGDTTWWDYSEAFPFGFIVNNAGTANTNVAFEACTANNNRWNGNTSTYWNGDGFVVEGNAVGVSFTACVAVNNEDGGYDIKPAATFTDCVSVKNYRGFRLWDTTKTLTNCVATYPYRRSNGNPTGAEGGSGIWTQNGTSSADNYTYHANAGTGVTEEGSGTISLTDSILAFTGATGSFTAGSVTLGTGTVTYRPGSGTDPAFVASSSSWDGLGTDMNSGTYGAAKGYFFSDLVLTDLSPTDDAHVRYGNSASGNYGSSQTLEIRNTGVNYRRYIFLRFNLSGLTGTITDAKLKLSCTSATLPDTHALTWVTNDSWTEGTITGANYSSGTATGITSFTPAANTDFEIDVTSQVAAQKTADGVITFRLISSHYESVQGGYASKENANAALRPVLSVTTE